MSRLLVLRPEPGGSRTLARAAALGLDAVACPLFRIEALDWTPPPAEHFDALLVTSVQTVRIGGGLPPYRDLPSYAVGQATGDALRLAGFGDVTVGDSDGAAIAARIARDGHREILHPAGADVAPFDTGPLTITRIAIYRSVEMADQATLAAFLTPGMTILVHSPRAGRRLAALVNVAMRGALHIIAISPAALADCGAGWASAQAADRPTDTAMLALAALLCERHSDATKTDRGTGPVDQC
jgi:uroporphyrinogen-III synthase